jgi:hypothetical protein
LLTVLRLVCFDSMPVLLLFLIGVLTALLAYFLGFR